MHIEMAAKRRNPAIVIALALLLAIVVAVPVAATIPAVDIGAGDLELVATSPTSSPLLAPAELSISLPPPGHAPPALALEDASDHHFRIALAIAFARAEAKNRIRGRAAFGSIQLFGNMEFKVDLAPGVRNGPSQYQGFGSSPMNFGDPMGLQLAMPGPSKKSLERNASWRAAIRMGIEMSPNGGEAVASLADSIIFATFLPGSMEEYVANASPENFVNPVGMVVRKPAASLLHRLKGWFGRNNPLGVGKVVNEVVADAVVSGARTELGREPIRSRVRAAIEANRKARGASNFNEYAVRERVSSLRPDDVARIAEMRSQFGVPPWERNFAYIEGYADGRVFGEIVGMSSKKRIGVAMPEVRQFEAVFYIHGREWDAEVFALEHLAQYLTRDSVGVFRLVSEKRFCLSCVGIISQFEQKFPGVTLILNNGF